MAVLLIPIALQLIRSLAPIVAKQFAKQIPKNVTKQVTKQALQKAGKQSVNKISKEMKSSIGGKSIKVRDSFQKSDDFHFSSLEDAIKNNLRNNQKIEKDVRKQYADYINNGSFGNMPKSTILKF